MKPYYSADNITIYHGDCREVLPELPARCVDLVLTDPPYAAAAATVTTGFSRVKWGGNWGDMSLVTLMASMVIEQPFLAPEHEVYWFCDHLSYAALVPFFFTRYPLIQNIVWDKDMLGVGAHYRKQTELLLYARTANAPQMRKDARDLIRIRPMYHEKEHPAAKPLPLVMELASATAWTTVLDPFLGSGTTLVAAKQLGRGGIGIEVEERWCEKAARRLRQQPMMLPPVIVDEPTVSPSEQLILVEAGQ